MLLPLLMNLGFAAGTVVTPVQEYTGSTGGSYSNKLPSNVIYLPDKKREIIDTPKIDNTIKLIIKEDDELLILIRAFLKTQP